MGFFVSTSATTSTSSTRSICYISTNSGPVACSGRKRRTVSIDFDAEENSKPSVQPSAAQLKNNKNGRFLLYWITTTSISTSTSYTTTITVSSVICTPSGTPFGFC